MADTGARRVTVAGGGDGGIPIGPGKLVRDRVDSLFTQDLNADGTTSGDAKNNLRPDDDAEYRVDTGRDLRAGRIVTVNSDAAGADTFTLSFACQADPDGTYKGTVDVDGVFTTGALNDDDSAATIQTAVRAALPGTDLTVITDPGPDFTITFDRKAWSRGYPVVTFNGTGCTATVTAEGRAGATDDTSIDALGESYQFSETNTILAPTLGTVTESVAAVDEVQTFDYSAGIDGGTISFGLRTGAGDKVTGGLAFDIDEIDFQAAIAALGADAPSVTVRGTSEVQTLELGDIAAADTYKLTADGVETSLITYAADSSADILAALIAHPSFTADDFVSITATDDDTYPITFTKGFDAPTLTITTVTGFTPTGVTATTAPVSDGFVFTFENGIYAGRPVGLGVLYVHSDLLDDGGVLEPGTMSVTTPGALSTTSCAYTENGSGDSILVAAVSDTTGESFGFVNDAASPVVFNLPPGTYHLVARTIEDGRLSKAANKAFTVTSA